MRKNQLNKTGLSMSQAQTVSNLCNQMVRDIQMNLRVQVINGADWYRFQRVSKYGATDNDSESKANMSTINVNTSSVARQ